MVCPFVVTKFLLLNLLQLPNKAASAWYHSNQWAIPWNQFRGKESFILWSKNGGVSSPQCVIHPERPWGASLLYSVLVCRKEGEAGFYRRGISSAPDTQIEGPDVPSLHTTWWGEVSVASFCIRNTNLNCWVQGLCMHTLWTEQKLD